MTIAIVQSVTDNAASTATFAANVTAGSTVELWQYAYTTSGASISTSNPTFNGSGVTGSKLFDNQSGGTNAVYGAVWELPNLAGGAKTAGITVTNGTVDSNVGICAIEVSGLNAAPALDSGAAPNPQTGTATSGTPDSGTTGAITAAPELILAMAVAFGSTVVPAGSPWTNLSPSSSDCQAGYQIVTSSGATYDYRAQNSVGVGWAAGVAAVEPGSGSTNVTASFGLAMSPLAESFTATETIGAHFTAAMSPLASHFTAAETGANITASLHAAMAPLRMRFAQAPPAGAARPAVPPDGGRSALKKLWFLGW